MLCKSCASIDLASYFEREIHVERNYRSIEASPEALRLGTPSEIYARYSQCNFCRLVFDAITHRSCRNEWLSTEWFLNESNAIGAEGQCVIYSYASGRCIGTNEDGSRKVIDGYRIAIGLTPKEKWPGSMFKAGEVALVRESSKGSDTSPLFFGRMIDPDRVNIDLVKKWLQICTERHGKECKVPAYDKDTAVPDNHPRNLLVIDVESLRLCPLPEESALYVALSYCWPQGAESSFQTTKAVYKELTQPNGLQSRLEDLTPVVRDAISFVREIGQRFLWVDALCIVQDDTEYKMEQIKQMDLVYGAALMTIMCAEPVRGKGFQDRKARELQPVEELHPGLGLPGYQPGTRVCSQVVANVGDLQLAVPFPSVDVTVRHSRWMTRAWTFQELSLAPRKLYFTESQIYFQCSCAVFAEDTVCEDQLWHSFNQVNTTLFNSADSSAPLGEQQRFPWISRSPPEDSHEAIQTYRGLHYEYTERTMTYPGDVLLAFQGMISILKRTLKTEFVAGLPEKYFHEALLWIMIDRFLIRSVTKDGIRSIPYPSWTWAGWMAPSSYMYVFGALGRDTYLVGEAEWFIDNRKTAWKLDVPVMSETTREKWGDRGSNHGAGPIPSSLKTRLQPRSTLQLDESVWDWSNHLAAWTTQAQFRITGDSYPMGTYGGINFDECENFIIFDLEGHEVGSIILRWETMRHLLSEGEIHDFILLSRSFEVGAQVTEKLKFFDEDMYPPRDWCYLSVMLIGEGVMRGTGSAARFGVGVIHEDAWAAAQPWQSYMYLQ